MECPAVSFSLQMPRCSTFEVVRKGKSNRNESKYLGGDFILFFLAAPCGLQDLSSPIEPGPSAVKAPSANHWTAREFPGRGFSLGSFPLAFKPINLSVLGALSLGIISLNAAENAFPTEELEGVCWADR